MWNLIRQPHRSATKTRGYVMGIHNSQFDKVTLAFKNEKETEFPVV